MRAGRMSSQGPRRLAAPLLVVASVAACSSGDDAAEAPPPAVAPAAEAAAPAKPPVAVPDEVPKPRGLAVVFKGEAGDPPKFVARAVTRKGILREVIPYLEYLSARDGHADGVVYLFDRSEAEAGVPLEPVNYFRFFLGSVQIKRGRGEFVENEDYFKDDEDPTPNGDEIELGYQITRWREEQKMTELGTEEEAARTFARKRGLDEDGTWRIYARVLDDSVSLGKNHFFNRSEHEGGKE